MKRRRQIASSKIKASVSKNEEERSDRVPRQLPVTKKKDPLGGLCRQCCFFKRESMCVCVCQPKKKTEALCCETRELTSKLNGSNNRWGA